MNENENIPKVMIIDDTAANLKLLDRMLRNQGYQVFSFPRGELALKGIRKNPPDLILLDINMPDMNGFEVCETLKSDNRFKEIPVIFISALNETMDKIKAFSVGGIDYITKPFQFEEVIARVETHLRLRQYQTQLVKEKIKAESATRAKSEFLANMSHEIRTPMNAILGFSEILQSRSLDDKDRRYLSSIQESGEALLMLINDILDLSKIESGKMELQYSPVSLHALFSEFNTLFFHQMEEKGLRFDLNIDINIPPDLILDKTRLRQVFINLLGNALKFTHKGFIKVNAKCKQPPKGIIGSRIELIFTVEDTGIGIPLDQQKNIFNSFEQVKGYKQSTSSGTGLGLSITWHIIELMQGTIQVTSKEGEGSLFTIHIPDVEVAEPSIESERPHPIDLSNIDFDPATILVVDDIDYNLEILSTYLSDWDFTFDLAENGKVALEKIMARPPDLILLDMKMPVMDGYELSTLLKEDERFNKIPIIAVSASALKQDEVLIHKNCESYLLKPVSRNELVKEVMKYLSYHINKNRGIEI